MDSPVHRTDKEISEGDNDPALATGNIASRKRRAELAEATTQAALIPCLFQLTEYFLFILQKYENTRIVLAENRFKFRIHDTFRILKAHAKRKYFIRIFTTRLSAAYP